MSSISSSAPCRPRWGEEPHEWSASACTAGARAAPKRRVSRRNTPQQQATTFFPSSSSSSCSTSCRNQLPPYRTSMTLALLLLLASALPSASGQRDVPSHVVPPENPETPWQSILYPPSYAGLHPLVDDPSMSASPSGSSSSSRVQSAETPRNTSLYAFKQLHRKQPLRPAMAGGNNRQQQQRPLARVDAVHQAFPYLQDIGLEPKVPFRSGMDKAGTSWNDAGLRPNVDPRIKSPHRKSRIIASGSSSSDRPAGQNKQRIAVEKFPEAVLDHPDSHDPAQARPPSHWKLQPEQPGPSLSDDAEAAAIADEWSAGDVASNTAQTATPNDPISQSFMLRWSNQLLTSSEEVWKWVKHTTAQGKDGIALTMLKPKVNQPVVGRLPMIPNDSKRDLVLCIIATISVLLVLVTLCSSRVSPEEFERAKRAKLSSRARSPGSPPVSARRSTVHRDRDSSSARYRRPGDERFANVVGRRRRLARRDEVAASEDGYVTALASEESESEPLWAMSQPPVGVKRNQRLSSGTSRHRRKLSGSKRRGSRADRTFINRFSSWMYPSSWRAVDGDHGLPLSRRTSQPTLNRAPLASHGPVRHRGFSDDNPLATPRESLLAPWFSMERTPSNTPLPSTLPSADTTFETEALGSLASSPLASSLASAGQYIARSLTPTPAPTQRQRERQRSRERRRLGASEDSQEASGWASDGYAMQNLLESGNLPLRPASSGSMRAHWASKAGITPLHQGDPRSSAPANAGPIWARRSHSPAPES